MSVQFHWDPSTKTGCFKIIHNSGATYTTWLGTEELEESSFRLLLTALDEEVLRKVPIEPYNQAFNNHPLSQDSRPRAPDAGRNRSHSAGLLGMGRRRRSRSGRK